MSDDEAFPHTPVDAFGFRILGVVEGGLTKREYFAGLAMQTLISAPIPKEDMPSDRDAILAGTAIAAVAFADALLAELAKVEQASFRLCSEEESRLRGMVIGLGLDPDAGVK